MSGINLLTGKNLECLLREAAQWSEETFPSATIQSISTHLAREAQELKEVPTDPMEIADVLLLLNHLAFRLGVSLPLAIELKMGINKKRKWGEVDEEGVVEHIKPNSLIPSHPSSRIPNY